MVTLNDSCAPVNFKRTWWNITSLFVLSAVRIPNVEVWPPGIYIAHCQDLPGVGFWTSAFSLRLRRMPLAGTSFLSCICVFFLITCESASCRLLLSWKQWLPPKQALRSPNSRPTLVKLLQPSSSVKAGPLEKLSFSDAKWLVQNVCLETYPQTVFLHAFDSVSFCHMFLLFVQHGNI